MLTNGKGNERKPCNMYWRFHLKNTQYVDVAVLCCYSPGRISDKRGNMHYNSRTMTKQTIRSAI